MKFHKNLGRKRLKKLGMALGLDRDRAELASKEIKQRWNREHILKTSGERGWRG